MAHATIADVETYLMRTIAAGSSEAAAATAYLQILELVIRRQILDFDTKIASGDVDFSLAVKYVEGSITADILRNPDRYQYEQAGDYAYSLQKVLQADSLKTAISKDMWDLLGVNRRAAFTIGTATWTPDAGVAPRWWSTIEKGV